MGTGASESKQKSQTDVLQHRVAPAGCREGHGAFESGKSPPPAKRSLARDVLTFLFAGELSLLIALLASALVLELPAGRVDCCAKVGKAEGRGAAKRESLRKQRKA